MKLEWEECPRPGCLWIGRADGCRYLATSGEEKLKIQGEHNAYIEQIAAANGYVKLEPGQVVVTMTLVYAAKFRMDDEILQGMETNDEAYAEALDVIHKFERGAALDASGGKP